LIDIYAEGESFICEQKFVADGAQKQVSIFSELFWLNYLRSRVSKASKILVEIEMEWGGELIRFDDLVFMIVDSALDAFHVVAEPMAAIAHFSDFTHFSNKIIKSITSLLINDRPKQKKTHQFIYYSNNLALLTLL